MAQWPRWWRWGVVGSMVVGEDRREPISDEDARPRNVREAPLGQPEASRLLAEDDDAPRPCAACFGALVRAAAVLVLCMASYAIVRARARVYARRTFGFAFGEGADPEAVSYTHLTLPTILRV